MGTFQVACTVGHITHRDRVETVPGLLVDRGSDYTWVPSDVLERLGVEREKKDLAFVMANGQQVTLNLGYAILRIDEYVTIDEVVFAQPGDMALLGARTLEGLNLRVSPKQKKLDAVGPLYAAARIRNRPILKTPH
jgi:predicted aspartyl protease